MLIIRCPALPALGMIALVSLPACSGQPLEMHGTVRLDGKAVAGAEVRLVPDGTDGESARGITDDDGEYVLISANPGGLKRGSYKVVVEKIVLAAIDPGWSPERKMEARRMAGEKPPVSALPARYADPKSTPFSCSVPRADAVLDLDLQTSASP